MQTNEIMPGTRVEIFDHLLFKNDKSTPLSFTRRPSTVVCRYGKRSHPCLGTPTWVYPDLIDVVFDHSPDRISCGHFIEGAKIL